MYYEDIFEEDDAMTPEMVEVLDSYEGLRSILSEEYADADYDELNAVFMEITADMSDEEAEIFGKLIKGIGKGIRKIGSFAKKIIKPVARVVAPISKVAFPAIGTIFGGPVGALAGQAGASLLGQLGRGGGPRRPSRRRSVARRGRARRRSSRAAGRLTGLLQSPQLRQALGSLLAGRRGRGSVRVGRTNIPVGALANLAGTLFAQAAAEAEDLHPTDTLPDYLLDDYGEAIDGIESADIRAERLWELLVDEGLLDDAIIAEADDSDVAEAAGDYVDDIFEDFEPLH